MSEQQQMTVVLDGKKVAELQASVPTLLCQVEECKTIVNNDDYLISGTLLDHLAERYQNISDFFEEPAKQANGVHKFITSLRSGLLQPLDNAITLLKKSRQEYRAELERQRLAKEEEERRIAKEEQDRQAIQEAAELEAMGETEAANTIIERAAVAPPPPVAVPSMVPKEKGTSVRKVWKYRVTNPALHKREFLVLDESKVGPVVARLGPDAAAIIGGIEVIPGEVETRRRK